VRRVILDTNVFVGSAYNAGSASRRIVDACREGKLRLVVSEPIRREYERMLPRAIRRPNELAQARELIDAAEVVEPGLTPRVVRDDPDDDKFFAAAWAGEVDAVISNDRGLLDVNGTEGVRIVRPGEFEAMF
jgi:putative PIN family toxin of toxin-antitoxin system